MKLRLVLILNDKANEFKEHMNMAREAVEPWRLW
jgi:hypothetical protein